MDAPMIHVHVEIPLAIEDHLGRWIRVQGTGRGVYFALPVETYRKHAPMGLFHRNLRRVRGHGREFWIDECWRLAQRVQAAILSSEAARPSWVPVAPPKPARRGCGCGGRTA